MDVASLPLNGYGVVSSVHPPAIISRNFYASLSLYRIPIQRVASPFLAYKSTGFSFQYETPWYNNPNGGQPIRSRLRNSVAAGVSNSAAVTNKLSKGLKLFNDPTSEVRDEPCEDSDEGHEDTDAANEELDDNKMLRVCDKLIGVFMVDKPNPADWRKLLTFSKEWNNIRPHFYKRCQDQANKEADPGMKHKLLRFARKLKEVDEDIKRHNELLQVLRNSPSDISEIAARRRKDFTKEFFIHISTVAESCYDNPAEQNAVAKLGSTCLAAVQAYDTATESIEALNAAELKFQDLINSPTVDAACRKIDSLAEKNELDSALVLMITKAWSAAKESNMAKDEVKDVLYHLYSTARGNLQRRMPKEIRILKYLLTIKDQDECMSALKDAFTPGEELEGKDVDSLYTTPEQLHTWIRTVVDAYQFSREGTLVREARDLMNPKVIQKLEELKKIIQDNFM